MVDLSPQERLSLINQYRILEALYPDEADDFKQNRTVLENGYASEIDGIFRSLTECYVSRELSAEVHDILLMFDQIGYAKEQIGDVSDIDEHNLLEFSGFDGNNEYRHLGYCRFILAELHRFERLKPAKIDSYNSHFPTIDRYRRMLEAWRQSERGANLSKDDLHRIALSAIHPENR